MKNMLPLLFMFLLFAHQGFSQVNAILPSDANAFYQNAMQSINPAIKNLIEKNANKLTGHKINTDSLVKELKINPLLKGGNENDLEAITVLILVQASKNADNNLKELVLHKRQTNYENDAEKEKDKNYASLLVENKSDIAESVSLIMKKLPGSPEMVMDKYK